MRLQAWRHLYRPPEERFSAEQVLRSRPDEVATAGEVYFFPAGHTLSYEEPSEVLELNPASALQALMDHFEKMMSAGWTG